MKRKAIIITISVVAVILTIASAIFLLIPKEKPIAPFLKIENKNIVKHNKEDFNLITSCNVTYKSNIKNQKVIFSSGSKLVKINALSGDVKCINKGEVIINVSLKLKDDNYLEDEILLTITDELILPTKASFENNFITINKNEDNFINKVNLVGKTNIIPKVKYKNNLVEYDYLTGKVKALSLTGEDIVYVEFVKSETEKLNIEFTVKIVEMKIINDEKTIILNNETKIDFNLETLGVGDVVGVPTVKDENIVKILNSSFNYVIVKGLTIGKTEIIVSCNTAMLIIKITVKN